MKIFTKFLSLMIAVLMLVTVAGCSKEVVVSLGSSMDDSWGFRHGDVEVPVGMYINFLNAAYQDAQGRYDGEGEMTLESKIKNDDEEEVTVKDFVASEARHNCLEYIVYRLDAKELLGDEKMYKQDEVDEFVDDYYKQMQDMYSQYGYTYTRNDAYANMATYGVSSYSYDETIAYDFYKDAIFKGLYATGGTKEVSDEEITQYFKDNYTHYRTVFASYKQTVTTDKDGTDTDVTTDVDGDTKKAYKDLFNDIAKSVKTTEDFENGVLSYMKEYEIKEDPTSANTVIIDEDADSEIIKAVKGLKANEATVVEAEDGSGVYLVFKGNIDDYVDFFFNFADMMGTQTEEATTDTATEVVDTEVVDTEEVVEETTDTATADTDVETDVETEPEYKLNTVTSGLTRDGLLYEYKDADFKQYVEDLITKYQGEISINEKELAKYTAEMFVTEE